MSGDHNMHQKPRSFVDADDISAERVDEIVNQEHDRAVELANAYERGWNAALAQQEPVAWQPIETAPKTGRKVILFYKNRLNVGRTVIARWLTDEQAAELDSDDVGLEGGWYECIDNWDDFTEVAIHEGEPSHWMPLPAPPIEALRQALEAKQKIAVSPDGGTGFIDGVWHEPARRKPLTNSQILEIAIMTRGRGDFEFVRAIEAAHGIKESA